MSAQDLATNLKVLADHFQYWLDWQDRDRASQGLATEGATALILHTPTDGVTPPVWPTRQALANIVALIREASAMAEQVHDAALEAKFND